MQERQRNLQQGVDAMMERIQKSDLGPKLKELYLCSARCFDTPSSNNQIQNCIQNCQQPIERNQQFMHEAMNSFQVNDALICFVYFFIKSSSSFPRNRSDCRDALRCARMMRNKW